MIRKDRYNTRKRGEFPPPPGCPKDAIVLSFPVEHDYHGIRLDRFIQARIPRLSRTRAQAIIRACAFHHDGKKRRPSDRVQYGEIVLLVRTQFDEPIAPTSYEVVFEDEWMYVVDKPAGLAVHPTATYHRSTLTYLLRTQFPKDTPTLVHRLDRETSGLLICAKSREAEIAFKLMFERREVKKTYLAIVRGEVREDHGCIEAALRPSKHERYHFLMEVAPAGQGAMPSRTVYEVIDRDKGHTLLRLHPHTGRQHQLRVHLAHIGHSIVGDKIYGPEGVRPFFDSIQDGMTADLLERLGHDRQALHAEKLSFNHPYTGKNQDLLCPLASDLRELWEGLAACGSTSHL